LSQKSAVSAIPGGDHRFSITQEDTPQSRYAILHGKEGQPDLHGTKGIEGNRRSNPLGAKRTGVNYKSATRKQRHKADMGFRVPHTRVRI